MGVFSRFLNCTNNTKSQKTQHLFLPVFLLIPGNQNFPSDSRSAEQQRKFKCRNYLNKQYSYNQINHSGCLRTGTLDKNSYTSTFIVNQYRFGMSRYECSVKLIMPFQRSQMKWCNNKDGKEDNIKQIFQMRMHSSAISTPTIKTLI